MFSGGRERVHLERMGWPKPQNIGFSVDVYNQGTQQMPHYYFCSEIRGVLSAVNYFPIGGLIWYKKMLADAFASDDKF